MYNGLTTNKDNELIGPVLYRENEDIIACTRIDDLIKTYTKYDIRKFFGLNINEFLDLPSWKINLLISNAEVFMAELSKDMSTIENSINNSKANNMDALKGLGK